ncbi:5-guanidino-2-oxopentanoate decarboxylase [Paracoccus sp. S1E-3]|uniref:5-guanidino-2-oxopentanoate decarboxylase n=1 Tax=Paracoccus sp. S1E-3 TaxID=2756130 RepID=UPI0015EFB80C|nr:5-guanidino-2-oxopentanoate decarboxylase [Paracoccus sp. S1E-3]MBA4491475.1 5-guanidino-2-oxopentanoate decarboxylase [Paracoccus sp. S1E-3]
MADRTCGEQIPHLLNSYGIDTVFGMPGVHSLEFYRTLEEAGIRHVGVRHEQGAGFMADGYARASRRPGVAMIISGPGVTNASTAIGQAYSDSVPVLLLTAAIASRDEGMGRGMLHEITDQRGLSSPITGLSAMAYRASQVPQHLARAFARFSAARPRPVHLSVPIDVLGEPLDTTGPVSSLPMTPGADPRIAAQIAALLIAAKRPVILAGGGAVNASDALRRLVERSGAVFVSTVAGKGILPESHAQSLGSTLQRLPSCKYIADADLVIAFGTEISEPDLYVTADVEAGGEIDPALLEPKLTMNGRFVRIDIDPDVLIRDYDPEIALLADARLAAEAILDAMGDQQPDAENPAETVAAIKEANRATLSPLEKAHDTVLKAVRAGLPPDALIYADMTQIGYTGCVTFPVDNPACWHFPMGFGTLGYALPAAIGGQIACPGRATAVIVGDGGFQFTLPELATAVEQRLPLPIILWDNDALGEIADFMKARQIPQIDVYPENPDFESLARAYRCQYTRASTPQEVTEAVQGALGQNGPTLIHVHQSAGWGDAAG